MSTVEKRQLIPVTYFNSRLRSDVNITQCAHIEYSSCDSHTALVADLPVGIEIGLLQLWVGWE